MSLATFAAGCFWGVEEAFLSSGLVRKTLVGYTGGHLSGPNYSQVCSGTTGHAEAVQLEFDPSKTEYSQLLALFWKIHDPTTMNRQGPDVGEQYRSAIFYHNEQQKIEAERSRDAHQNHLNKKIVTQIAPVQAFYPAEEYHQQYIRKSGNNSCRF